MSDNPIIINDTEQQTKSNNPTEASSENKIALSQLEKKMAQLIKKALPGKAPIRFSEIYPEEIEWEKSILKEPEKPWREVLTDLTATTDPEIAFDIFLGGVNAFPGENLTRHANIAAQVLADTTPRDATEARLCLQEASLYAQGMHHLSRADNCDMISQAEFHMKTAIKLLRLHNETIEARSKYRRGGEQRVVVQHVSVAGQAIVNNGNMVTGGGKEKK